MKKLLFSIIFFYSLPYGEGWGGASFSQNFQKYYDRDFGTTNSIGEVGHAVIQTSDGGYMAVGYSDNYGIGLKDIFAVRLNSNGDTVWTKLYGNAAGNDMARAVIQTSDGGFAIAAETQSGAGAIDAAILKIDANGILQWSKAFGGNKDELGHSIIEMSDGSLILAGQALSYSVNDYDEIFLVKVDATGTFLWAKTLNGGSGELARYISKTSDGGFIISGDESSFNYGFYMAKFNSNGDTTWCRGYRAQITSYEGHAANQTSDGGYIMTGFTYGGSIGGTDIIALKVNSSGAITWTKEIGTINYDYGSDIIQTNDGGYAISGTASPGGSYYEMMMAKLNSSGVLQWSKIYSGDYGTTYATDMRFQVTETSDNGLISIGSIYNNFGNTLSQLYNGYDMCIVKTDAAGDGITTGCARNANLQTANATWNSYNAPFVVSAISPTVTTSPFTQKFTAGNSGNVEVKLNFSTVPVSCGACDGSATANTCDTGGFYCSGKNPYTYLWSSGQTDMTATALCYGSYNITITDYIGCKGIGTVSITSAAQPVEICLVTVDSTSTKNLIVWEKPVSTGIDSFIIYREIGLNNYVKIGAVAYEDLSKFTDTTLGINPNITSYRYKISTLDTCENESAKSAHHRTIHLSTPQFTPPITFDLIWTNNYEGFNISQYYILRDINSSGNWTVIDSVTFGNNSYTDINSDSAASYIVEATHPGGSCLVTKSSENHNSSRSNKTYPLSAPGGINESGNDFGFEIYPNPNGGKFNLRFTIYDLRFNKIELKIYNVLGEIVYSSAISHPSSVNVDLSKHGTGIYFLQLNNGEKIYRRKLIVE